MELLKRCCLRASVVVALLALAGAAPALAAGALTRQAYRVKASCATPRRAHGATCDALRLLPASLSAADIRAAARAHEPARANSAPLAGGLTPQQLHGAYELPSETTSSGSQTVAVVDAYNDPTAEADLGVFDRQFGLPECTKANGCFRKINEHGAESPLPKTEGLWASEITIDVQMAHAICQNCHIVLVETTGEENPELGSGVNAAVAAGATEISNSYGSIEAESAVAAEERMWNEKAYDHPGVVITASTGDCGNHDQNNPEHAPQCDHLPSNVGFPAASPDIVAVGGTELKEGTGTWSSRVWGNSGGGCTTIFSAPPWQTSVSNWSATGCATERLDADVSAVADPYTGVDVYDSTPEEKGGETGWTIFGGTSVASPIVAAEFALAGGSRGVEYPAQTLYGHIGEADALYDVTAGSNGSCGGATSCAAAVGYDGPSGVGSPLGLSAFAPSAGVPVNTSAPAISGAAQVGHMLSALVGAWTNSPSSTLYQWEDCNSRGSGCLPIQGATSAAYTVASSDAGATIRVMETASNASGFGAPAISAQTAAVGSGPAVPTIRKMAPKSALVGATVKITGTHFAGVSSVAFGSEQASFSVESETTIVATVPAGTGAVYVTVSTEGGTTEPSNKTKFKYKKAKKAKG